MSSLFDSEAKKSSNWKLFLIGFLALVVLGSVAYGLYLRSAPREKTAEEFLAEEIRDSTVYMLAQPTFSGEEFKQQILGKGRLERYHRREREAFFSFPESSQAEFDDFLNKYFVNPAKVEIGEEKNGRIKIDEYTLTVSPEAKYFFKSKLENIKIDSRQTLNFPFQNVNYSLGLDELKGFTDNSKIYGGKLIAEASTTSNKPKIIFANHGMMVAKPNEPSLKRLTDSLLQGETDREKRIQKLLDFVSNEIEYSYTEAVAPRETLKRADEVLMTRVGDCSNKTILLASLLEQIGEDYILLYCPKHITVAVPQGNFADDNKLDFVYENKNYLIAESTFPGFQIGQTQLGRIESLINVNYVQSPKQIDLIFDAKSYTYLNFW